ncbi:hypothetical protein ACS0TY_029615 [Phlomoides rotata]
MGITHFGAYPVCSHETLKPIGVRSVTRMPFLAHENNRHEQDITETCIRHMGRSLQDLISEWIRKLSSREVDRTRLQLNHSETITPQTFVCSVYLQKHSSGMTAGTGMLVGHNTTMKIMLGKGTSGMTAGTGMLVPLNLDRSLPNTSVLCLFQKWSQEKSVIAFLVPMLENGPLVCILIANRPVPTKIPLTQL